ncbi:hypothetical protein V8D89_003631 [Ganoderma adspersum]
MTTPPMMKLTHDTLLHVISLTATVKDAIPLIETCRILYHEGAKIALKKPITILDEDKLTLFLRFLRADDLSRCRYLRQLELWYLYPDSENLPAFVETLPRLVNLEYLRLLSAEELLEPCPALPPAFAALTNLRYLDLSGAKEVTCGILAALRSPLVSLRVDFVAEDDVKMWDVLDSNRWPQYHPTRLLKNFTATLEELHCVSWYTTEHIVAPVNVYPNVRRLGIELHDFPLRIHPFISAFPNLADLYLNTEYHGGYYSQDIERSHQENVARQLDPVNSCGTWTRLEHVYGSLYDLYAIGITSHIPRLTIGDTVEGEHRKGMLATVLRYAGPLHLKLGGITGCMLGFISMLHHNSASNLTNLDVCIYFRPDDREKDFGRVIVDLFEALGVLPLRFLQLRFHTYDLDPTPRRPGSLQRRLYVQQGLPEPPEPVPAPLTPAELSLNALDVDVLVTRMEESVRTLEVAQIIMPRSRRGGETFEKTIMKGTSLMPGREQWHSWIPGKNRFVWLLYHCLPHML